MFYLYVHLTEMSITLSFPMISLHWRLLEYSTLFPFHENMGIFYRKIKMFYVHNIKDTYLIHSVILLERSWKDSPKNSSLRKIELTLSIFWKNGKSLPNFWKVKLVILTHKRWIYCTQSQQAISNLNTSL